MNDAPPLGPGSAIFRAADATIMRLAAERDQLAAIVRDLAAVDPTGFDPDCCTLCHRVIAPAGEPHAEDCPWVRAQAFTETPDA